MSETLINLPDLVDLYPGLNSHSHTVGVKSQGPESLTISKRFPILMKLLEPPVTLAQIILEETIMKQMRSQEQKELEAQNLLSQRGAHKLPSLSKLNHEITATEMLNPE